MTDHPTPDRAAPSTIASDARKALEGVTPKKRRPRDTWKRVVALADDGMTSRQITEATGFHDAYVRATLRRHGLLKPRPESVKAMCRRLDMERTALADRVGGAGGGQRAAA